MKVAFPYMINELGNVDYDNMWVYLYHWYKLSIIILSMESLPK